MSGQDSETRIEELFDFPVEDPGSSLPETARRILDAARRLLLRGGFEALRWDAIAVEAGRNKSAIKYYFGNKDGLLLALIDSLDYEDCVAIAERTRGSTGHERLARFVEGKLGLASDAQGFLVFYDLLPRVIRDNRLRPRVADLYVWYYKMNIIDLGLEGHVRSANRHQLVALGALMTAITDGLALQAALRPKGFDLKKAFAVFRFFLEHSLEDFVAALDAQAGEAECEGGESIEGQQAQTDE